MGEKTGPKPKYTSVDQITDLIDEYFKYCEGEPLTDEEGNILFNKRGDPIILNQHPPTVTGLAFYLGFHSRQTLLNYQARKEFKDVITKAKMRVEMYTEEALFNRDTSNGARFSLQNNFKGWREEHTSEEDGNQKEIVIVEMTRRKTEATPHDDTNTEN